MCRWIEVDIAGRRAYMATDTDELAECIGCEVSDLVSKSGELLECQQCLCDLDVDKTAEKFGFSVDWNPEVGEVKISKGA